MDFPLPAIGNVLESYILEARTNLGFGLYETNWQSEWEYIFLHSQVTEDQTDGVSCESGPSQYPDSEPYHGSDLGRDTPAGRSSHAETQTQLRGISLESALRHTEHRTGSTVSNVIIL